MASFWFLKLLLKCLDHVAWPLLALGYPLCASVQAIETDSYKETRNLISYWIFLSLIYLFEYAFSKLLLWFQFWPYIKLMIIFWLVIPDFGQASIAYNNLIRTCISFNPQAIICRLDYWKKFFIKKDNFLQHAERYVKENGTETLEKLIASKNTTYEPDAEATNGITAIGNKEMQEITIMSTTKPYPTSCDHISTNLVQTNEIKLQTEHKAIKDLEVIDKKEIPAGKQNALPAMVETKTIVGKDKAGVELPQNSYKEVQKEWTCALCQVTTTSLHTLNMHLQGKKHRAICETLNAKNQPFPQKQKSGQSKEELKQKNIIYQLNSKVKNGESIVNNGLKRGKEVKDHDKVQKVQKKAYEPAGINNFKLRCEVCNVCCPCKITLASHKKGKKHLANIQKVI